MALALYDRVQETTATTGTGSITLGGAVSGYQSFAVVGDGNTCYYTIVNGSAWEVGIGTYSTTGPTLARTTILSNSNADTSPITLVGASSVFLTYPAEKSVNLNADGVMEVGSPINYTDTGILATFASTEADYNQVVIQNKSNSPTASANLNISNNVSTGTTGFAELGINSSTFTGTNSFELPGAAYLASASTDLVLGTYGAYNIHFLTNSNDVDAMTIYDNGGISLGELSNPGIGNIACNNINLKFEQVVTSGGTTTLTNASPYYTQFTGTTTHTLKLPDATTCLVGTTFILDNDSTDNVTIKDGADTTFELLIPGGVHNFVLEDNSTVAGTWLRYSSVPSTVEWGTNSLQLSTTVISGGTWQGGTIQSGYGGTGLTTFTAANNALYSTGASTLTAGTLPIAAGGTGRTSFTSGYIPYGNGTSGLNSSSSLQFNGTYLVVGGATPLGGATNPITAFSSTAAGYVQTYVYNTSNDISASADFVTYADNSTDAHGWADMGFTSSTYNDPVYTVTGPNEAYILGSAPSGAGATGNLVYATDSTGSANAHQWYVGGFTQAKSAYKMQLDSTGLRVAGNAVLGTGSANNTTIAGAATGLVTTVSATGSDTNVGMAFKSKGTGAIDLAAGSSGVNISNGGTVTAITRTNPGNTFYTSQPSCTITAPTTAGGVQATGTAIMYTDTGTTVTAGGTGYTVGDILTLVGGTPTGSAATFTVATVSAGVVLTVTPINFAAYSVLPSSPAATTGGTGTGCTLNVLWKLNSVSITNAGSGYVEQPTVSFSGGGGSGAAAYATVGSNTVQKTIGNIHTFATPNSSVLALVDKNASGNYPTNTSVAFAMIPQQSSFGASYLGFGNAAYLATTGTSASAAYQFATAAPAPISNGSGGATQMTIGHTASAVNYVQVTGAATGGAPTLSVAGSDTNIAFTIAPKGGGAINLSGVTRLGFNATNYITASGAATTVAPSLTVGGTDTNIDLALTPKGTGNVVATTGSFSGSGSLLTSLNASNLASGTVPTARLASGSASSSTYLRGDQTWATISAGTPGGSTTQVQYNSAGAFAGSANLTFDGTNLTCGGTVTANSDETLKTNWRDFADDFVEQLAKVKNGTYDRVDLDITQDGVSAQSLQRLMPNSVLKGEDGKLSVAYGNAALVAAIKLAERVVELEARLAALEK